MGQDTITRRLTEALSLSTPPVALTFVQEAPQGIPAAPDPRPSACSFWRDAEHGVFYASAAAHFNCPIGAMVMGFPLPEETSQQLGGLMGMMCECAYLDAQEADKVPSMGTASAGIVYGPLAEHPLTPDLVLLWLSPKQAMLYNEAAGSASWAAPAAAITGRPACAALPLAAVNGTPTMSLGCIGMRTFTEVTDDRMLAVVPRQHLEAFTDAAEAAHAANETMSAFYQHHKQQVAATAG
jgi:uncharacterized protein (DUF169 family)